MEGVAAAYEGGVAVTFAAFPALVAYYNEFTALPQWQAYSKTPMGQACHNGPDSRFSAMVMPEQSA
jgi:hypothetical protein